MAKKLKPPASRIKIVPNERTFDGVKRLGEIESKSHRQIEIDKSGAMALGAKCDECPLRRQPIVYSQSPIESNGAGIIGLAPAKQEVAQGKVFIGPSGILLQAALDAHNFKRDKLFITNLTLCRQYGDGEPDPVAVQCCMPRLKKELKAHKIRKVLALGAGVRNKLCPQISGEAMRDSRGGWAEPTGIKDTPLKRVLISSHPAFLLHGNPEAFADFSSDVYKFIAMDDVVFYEPKAIMLNTLEEVKAAVKDCMDSDLPIALDLETSNRDKKLSSPKAHWLNMILCMGFHYKKGVAYIIPEEVLHNREVLEAIRPMLEEGKGIYGHNLKFDAIHLMLYYSVGLKKPLKDLIPKMEGDTLLMHACLDERTGTHSLKALSKYWIEAPDYETEIHRYLPRRRIDSYALAPRNLLHKYLAYDIHCTITLREVLSKQMEEQNLWRYPYEEVLIKAMKILTFTEWFGIPVDKERLAKAERVIGAEVENIANAIRDLVKVCDPNKEYVDYETFNPNATKQVAAVIYDALGLKPPKSKGWQAYQKSNRSTNKDVLGKLEHQHEFPKIMMKYRRWQKLYSTYAKKIGDNVDETRMRGCWQYNIAGTETGRVSAGLLMTIPRKYTPEGKLIRDIFRCPEGWKFISSDYSQAELRWFGWYAIEPFLHDVYAQGKDLHSEAAIQLFGPNYTKEQRIYTKMLNFSFAYGGTEHSFAEDTGVPIAEARELVREYQKVMPRAAQWREDTFELVRQQGWLRSALGRYRRFPVITNKNMHSLKNESINYRVQSLCSDCTMIAYYDTFMEILKRGLPAEPVLFMHDGTYFIVKDDPVALEETKTLIYDMMMKAANDIMEIHAKNFPEYADLPPITFKVDVEVGDGWGDV